MGVLCRNVVFIVTVAGLFLAGQRSPTLGCAAIGLRGAQIQIVDEDAIIVYDSSKKIQHFIRRASFRALAPNFGFLVPTPSVPILTEVDDAAFAILGKYILPKVREVSGGFVFASLLLPTSGAGRFDDAKHATKDVAVKVLAEAKVGGFNAVVLEADDAGALEKWLKDNEYPTTPELTGWLAPYLAQKWKITAFKIEKDANSGRAVVSTKAVKMSFATERPFFPYREPEVTAHPAEDEASMEESRVLRVFFLGNNRMAGSLGAAPWNAETVWADAVDASLIDTMAKDLGIPHEEFPKGTWLTVFKDTASPRPGTAEVFFDASADKSVKRPPDIIVRSAPTVIPLEPVLVVVLFVGTIVYLALRRTKNKS